MQHQSWDMWVPTSCVYNAMLSLSVLCVCLILCGCVCVCVQAMSMLEGDHSKKNEAKLKR